VTEVTKPEPLLVLVSSATYQVVPIWNRLMIASVVIVHAVTAPVGVTATWTTFVQPAPEGLVRWMVSVIVSVLLVSVNVPYQNVPVTTEAEAGIARRVRQARTVASATTPRRGFFPMEGASRVS
jgi:hypothetical protein